MKAKRRVVTASGRPAGARRTPAPPRSRPVAASAPTRETTQPRVEPVQPRPSVSPRLSLPQRPGAPTRATRAADDARDIEIDLSVDLGRGLLLPNPILVASGTFGYGVEYGDVVEVDRLGAICCKGTTLKARIGNPTPRVTETPGGMLNSIGLQNPGVDAVIEKYAKTWARWKVPVIVNVAGESVRDYVEVTRRLEGVPGIAGIELNIS
ncbi:MAG: dihydroorotate dehydrogenase catalytic subunit, partial [Chloroflexota bacterium]|nr:dihydroorotate dehydrogenase catalytic subunit [Chloroflexota bacterium]